MLKFFTKNQAWYSYKHYVYKKACGASCLREKIGLAALPARKFDPCDKIYFRWRCEDKDIHKKREHERLARAVIPKRYPDFYPPAVEKWDEWNKIDGFGLKQNNNSSNIVVKNKPDE